jgi:hypothetical protein
MTSKKNSPTTYLAIIFLALLIVAILLKNNPFKKESVAETLLPDISAENISKVNFMDIGGENIIQLEKNNEDWILTGEGIEATTAAFIKVENLINTLALLNKENLISQNPDKFVDFNLSDDLAKKIILTHGEDSINLMVGKDAANFSGSYIRVQNDNFVYKSKDPLSTYFSTVYFQDSK